MTDKEDISTEDIIKATEMVRDLTEEEIMDILLSSPLFRLLFDEED